jgi:signal peptidase I
MDVVEKYPRWVGVLLSLFFPGAGQYFAGAKRRGVLWFVVLFLWPGLVLLLLAEPAVPGLAPAAIAAAVGVLLWLIMLWDARRPVERLDWVSFAAVLLCGLVLLLLGRSLWPKWCAEVLPVPNNSMAPTLRTQTSPDGKTRADVAVIERCAYWLNEPRRGDIIMFQADGLIPNAPPGRVVFRLVALPGERVSIENGHLAINGQVVTNPTEFGQLRYLLPQNGTLLNRVGATFQVPAGHYFVLGDNSFESLDSRFWGPVPRDHIVGRITRICWPPERAATFK